MRAPKNAHERVQPGDVMPAGERPVCNASAMFQEAPQVPPARPGHYPLDMAIPRAFQRALVALANISASIANVAEYTVAFDPAIAADNMRRDAAAGLEKAAARYDNRTS